MQRKNFYLSNLEIQMLDIESGRLDISVSDLIRRIIDKHFEEIQTVQNYNYPEEYQFSLASGNSI